MILCLILRVELLAGESILLFMLLDWCPVFIITTGWPIDSSSIFHRLVLAGSRGLKMRVDLSPVLIRCKFTCVRINLTFWLWAIYFLDFGLFFILRSSHIRFRILRCKSFNMIWLLGSISHKVRPFVTSQVKYRIPFKVDFIIWIVMSLLNLVLGNQAANIIFSLNEIRLLLLVNYRI